MTQKYQAEMVTGDDEDLALSMSYDWEWAEYEVLLEIGSDGRYLKLSDEDIARLIAYLTEQRDQTAKSRAAIRAAAAKHHQRVTA